MTDEHLHDEALSDAVDGLVPADVTSHLVICGQCRSRLDAMRAAAEAVAAPPPPRSAAARDDAVARALGAAAPARGRPAVAPWMAAAALVALLLGAVGVVMAGQDGGRNDETAASRLQSPKTGGAADASGAAGAAGLVDAGDLGDQRDAVTLNALLEERLAQPTTAAAPAFAAEGGGSGATEDGAPSEIAATAATSCVAEAETAGSGRVGGLVLTGRLRWQGEPAVVLVFAAPDQSQLGRRAFVMARRDCRLLVVQSF